MSQQTANKGCSCLSTFYNCYFTVSPKIFCQIIDIPMGSDPAPFLPTDCYTFMKVSG